jgi:hypothetical protein
MMLSWTNLETAIQSLIRSRRACLLMAIGSFLVSRCAYYWMGVRFDAGTLPFYWQIIDPALLRDALWQSLLYSRTQPPGFNFYIGAMMHLFPRHSVAAFQATSLGLGLVLTVCLFLLLDRLRVNRPLALLITIICVVSPVTVLYENWLFYEYPIAVLFCVSALFLHRYAGSRRTIDGIVLFSSLALLGLLRVFYNVVWFGMMAGLIAYALPRSRRRTVLCAAGPGAVLALISLKSLILFGPWSPGSDVIGAMNLAAMATFRLPKSVLAGMASRGEISPILTRGIDADLADIVPTPPKTGIPILDQRLKSTGPINQDSAWMQAVAIKLSEDGLAILRAHPEAALSNIVSNIQRYFLPADNDWPFDGRQQRNRRLLSPMLDFFALVLAGKRPGGNYAWISYVTIPLLLWFGFRRSARWAKRLIRHPNSNARSLTLGFAVGNVLYLTGVVILFSSGDQNRYAFEVFPLYTILLGYLAVSAARRVRVSRTPLQPYVP